MNFPYVNLYTKPVKRLKKIIKYSSKGKALDIGAGNGRNSFFLAKNGFEVTAIDISPENIEFIKKISEKQRLNIKAKLIDVRKFKFSPKTYSLIIAISVLDFLKRKEVEKTIKKIKKALKNKGIFYLSVFSIRDPFFKRFKENFKEVERNTFFLPRKQIFRHFFTKKEVKDLLKGLEIISFEERRFRDTSHGSPHFHTVIECIVKKEI